MPRRLRFLKAYGNLIRVLASYFFFSFEKRFLGEGWALEKRAEVHQRNARRIERTVLDLKGLFIKVGQMLSIMSNFLPEAFTQGLEGLQDAVPPHPYEAIEKRFFEEFGKSPRDIFAEFSETPLASASLGQVHEARLTDGTRVAVKVQYPEIEAIVRDDLKTMKRIFGLLHWFFPVYGLRYVYTEIAEVVTAELDYTAEGKNLELLKKNFENEPDFVFPDVFWDYSSPRVLTLRFVEGIKINAVEEIKKAGIDPSEVAKKLIHAYCKQIFVDGVYHADPHPGNLLVQSEPPPFKIVLIDFGATARISEKMRTGITLFAEGLIKKDTRMLANAMREMGFVARKDRFEPFDDLVDYFYGKLSSIRIDNFRNLNFSQMQNLEGLLELRKMNISFRDLMTSFHVPKDWILLERTLLLAMGLCARLDPQLNPIDIVLPYVETFVLKDRTLKEVAAALVKEIVLSYLQLPHEIHKTFRRLNEGNLSFRSPDLQSHTRQVYRLGHQFLYGLLMIAGVGFGAYWNAIGENNLAPWGWGGAAFFGLSLVVSFIRNRL